MPALRELQQSFAAALFDETNDAVRTHVRAGELDAGARVGIYRNNLREAFIKALAIGFPVIEKLVGAEYFRQIAHELLRAHPSRNGNLHHIGEPFAPFLRERFEGTQFAYLSDVAALEWAHQQALVAEEAAALTVDAFSGVDPHDYERLVFELHPACGLVCSDFPIVRIWKSNQNDSQLEDPGEEIIDLASGGDNVLVLRTPECIEFHRLPAAEFALLQALSGGVCLGDALERAQAVEPDFDLGAALRHVIELRILASLQLPAPSNPGQPQ